jgi:hypothetical protein
VRKSNPEAKVVETRPTRLRCAIYTRKSTEEGLDQEFNSLDAQREAAEVSLPLFGHVPAPLTERNLAIRPN